MTMSSRIHHVAGTIAEIEARGLGLDDPAVTDNAQIVRCRFEETVVAPHVNEYRTLTANLIIGAAGTTPVRTLVFVGPTPGIGTSTIAASWSAVVAREERYRVLLIDADYRAPRLHEFFDMKCDDGLGEVVEAPSTLSSCIRATAIPGLHLLTAGSRGGSLFRAFTSGAFHRLLDEARAAFDYVVMDGPPLNACAEALLLASHGDGVILTARAEQTRREVLQSAVQRLSAANGRVIGVVLSGRVQRIPSFIYRRL
jgi:capsular exopolysaccharide synthesis family protein